MEDEARQFPRAKVKWPVVIQTDQGSIEAVTVEISPNGGFIRCPKPLRLNEILELKIDAPNSDHPLTATAEVVWSNIYGPDDEITPRGMGVRFIKISGAHRKALAKAVLDKLKLDNVDTKFLQTLEIAAKD